MKNENKKHLVFRNLILGLTLLVCIFIAVIAWFSSVSKADANGLSITTVTSLGLESSFTGDSNDFKTELEKTLDVQYPLITGDGENFFMPVLNRSTGIPLNDGTNWIKKRTPVANEDFYEEDIYFRSKSQLDVYLSGASSISPNSTTDNFSTFGNFSRDYIAGASRVAVFDVTKEDDKTTDANEETLEKKLLWIPNDNYELKQGDDFTEIPTESSGGSGINTDPNVTFGLNNTAIYEQANYWLWEGHANKTNHGNITAPPISQQMFKNKNDGLYYGAIEVTSDTDLDHFIDITKSSALNISNTSIQGTQSSSVKSLIDYNFNDNLYWIGVFVDGTYNITYNSNEGRWAKMVVDADPNKETFFGSIDRFQVLLTYDSSSNQVVFKDFIFFNSTTGEIGGGTGDYGLETKTYILNNDDNIVITGTNSSSEVYALAFEENSLSSSLMAVTDDKIASGSVPDKCVFNVEKANSQYYFKHIPTNKYLSVNANNQLTLSDETLKTPFSLLTGTNGCQLYYDGKYISLLGESFYLDTSKFDLKIYKGTTYTLNSNSTAAETYKYYSGTGIDTTDFARSDYMLTSDLSDNDKNVPLVRLKKDSDSDYYIGHIKLRIWVEGTDREAKIPLVNGKFSNNLVFKGEEIKEETA